MQMFLVLRVKTEVWLMATAFSYATNLCNQCSLAAKEGMKVLRWSKRRSGYVLRQCLMKNVGKNCRMHKGQTPAFQRQRAEQMATFHLTLGLLVASLYVSCTPKFLPSSLDHHPCMDLKALEEGSGCLQAADRL